MAEPISASPRGEQETSRAHHDELVQRVRYVPDTGRFYSVCSGRRIDRPHQSGYRRVTVAGRTYWAHRLAWFYMTRAWPPAEIDHANRARSDNRWPNLRLATHQENSWNKQAKGYYRARSRWAAVIEVNGERHYLGRFDSPEEARGAYLAAKAKLHAGIGL